MENLTQQQQQYLTDEMYTPIYYKGKTYDKPYYKGNGNHSVAELEAICRQYEDFCHQQSIIKQSCMKHVVELKFGTTPN